VTNADPGVVVAGAIYTNVVVVTNRGQRVTSNLVVVDVGGGGVLLEGRPTATGLGFSKTFSMISPMTFQNACTWI
jgi:hypothetical protein